MPTLMLLALHIGLASLSLGMQGVKSLFQALFG
jgi:hypothetical protein